MTGASTTARWAKETAVLPPPRPRIPHHPLAIPLLPRYNTLKSKSPPGAAAMSVHSTSPQFKDNAHKALHDVQLQRAMGNVRVGFIEKRVRAADKLPEFEALRDSARDIKNHVLAHLDLYLEAYVAKVEETGGVVHFARDAAEARRIVTDICKAAGARTVTKGKSMIAEEIGLNAHLEGEGIAPIETDLGEYIIQLRHEAPSHIIAPAVHVNASQVWRRTSAASTSHLDAERDLLRAGVAAHRGARSAARPVPGGGRRGSRARTSSSPRRGRRSSSPTRGNGDLTQILPKTHVVLASLGEAGADAGGRPRSSCAFLARSATGQELSVCIHRCCTL